MLVAWLSAQKTRSAYRAKNPVKGRRIAEDLIELHRRVARGFRTRERYRLCMLLIGGGLTHPRPS